MVAGGTNRPAGTSRGAARRNRGAEESAVTKEFVKEDCLYVQGRGSRGQLGLGNETGATRLTVAPFFSSEIKVRKVFCAYDHTFVLTSTDEVYSFGRNSKGQLGIGNTVDQSIPQKVHLLCGKGVSLITGGLEFSVALTESDDVYSWGSGSNGQLGVGYISAKEQTPQRVESLCGLHTRLIACGRNHSLLLTASDEVYGWGDNARGQLGTPNVVVVPSPVKIEPLCHVGVVQLGCGYQFSLCLTKAGQVWGCGDNTQGQLGMGMEEVERTPSLLEALRTQHVVCVAAGKEHALALTRNDDIWAWGSNEYGQLGLPQSHQEHEFWPRRVVSLGGKGACSIVCGRAHTLVQTQGGACYVMGSNLYGELGIGRAAPEGEAGEQAANDDEEEESGRIFQPLRSAALSHKGLSIMSKGSSCFVGRWTDRQPRDEQWVERGMQAGLMRDFASLLETGGDFSDLTVAVDGEPFHLHRAILVSRCPELYYHCAADHKERRDSVEVTGVPLAAFRTVLEFVYTGDTKLRSNELGVEALFDVMVAARRFKLSRLQGLCEKRVEASISLQTLPYVLRRTCDDEACPFLKRQCLQFALDNYAQVAAPSHALRLVMELREQHPRELATVLALAVPFKANDRSAPCIDELPASSDVLCEDCFPEDFGGLFDRAVLPSVRQAGQQQEGEEDDDEQPPGTSHRPSLGNKPALPGDFRVRLGVGGPCVRVHRVVLGCRSDFFASLFRSGRRMAEAGANEVVLKLEPVPTMASFLHFLRFLYTGRTDTIEPAHALDIITMTGTDEGDDEDDDEIEDDDEEEDGHLRRGSGGFFQIRNSHQLRRQCRQRLEHGVTVGNVVALLCRAHSIANEAVKRRAMSFLLSNFRETADAPGFEALQLHPELAMEVLANLKTFDIRPPQAQADTKAASVPDAPPLESGQRPEE